MSIFSKPKKPVDQNKAIDGLYLGAMHQEVVLVDGGAVIRLTPKLARELADKLPDYANMAELIPALEA